MWQMTLQHGRGRSFHRIHFMKVVNLPVQINTENSLWTKGKENFICHLFFLISHVARYQTLGKRLLVNFRSEYEYDYEYEFSVLSTRTLKNVDLET